MNVSYRPLKVSFKYLLFQRVTACRTERKGKRGHGEQDWELHGAGVGGTDTGPSPYGLLLAALGSCTSMTLRMYADRKKWPLQGVTVHLHREKVHAEDCAECETRVGCIEQIERRIELAGPLDESQRQRLLEIANMCPVHRTLKAETQITTTLL